MSVRALQARGASRIRVAIWVALGALLLATAFMRSAGSRAALPVLGTVPQFELLDQDARAFRSEDLHGAVWVASFIYTTCPGPCPRVVRRVLELDQRISHDNRVRLVSITVDPQADTPDVLSVFARTHGIRTDRWSLLTGPTDPVMNLVRRGFFLGVERAEDGRFDAETLSDQGAVIHSTRLVLVDDAMRLRGFYDSDDANDMKRLAADVRALADRVRRG